MRLALLLALATATLAAENETVFRARIRQVVEWNAAQPKPADPNSGGYQHIAAKLWLRQDAEWCSRRLEALLKDPAGDMFWMFPMTAIAYLGRDQLSPSAQAALRNSWKTYMPYRGDTENHWLLYYSTLYLMAQLYPNQPGETWFTGKSSSENLREAEGWILQWMDLTLTRGQGEFDCPHYMGVYLLPLSYLAAWAEDPRMHRRATMMLDYVIADYAAENLGGLYVGAHARSDDRMVLEKWATVGSDFGWILFGLGHPLPGYSSYGLFYCVASAYQPPEVLYQIATDRSQDYTHRELKRTRNRWRYTDVRHAPVYKTTYMRRDYAVSSLQGGVLQPAQQHSWDVTWALPDPRGVHNTLFSLHPYNSLESLQEYYTNPPAILFDTISRIRTFYDKPDKLLGGSPYEQIFQDKDAVIALYDIPQGTRYEHVNGFFSKDLSRVEEHPSGWIFAQGGSAYIAWRSLAPYEWRPLATGSRRLVSPHRKNGVVVQVAAAGEFADFAAFQQAIVGLALKTTLDPAPSVRFRSLRGRDLEFVYGKPPRVSGAPVNYQAWPLFDGPFLRSEKGSRKLVLTHGPLRRTLDFNDLTVSDSGRP